MSDYDVAVIGAGPGGYVAAIKASQLGLKTAIIEKEYMGGVCLNVGCIPSKSLLKNAELAHTLRERADEFGFSFENLELDYAKAVDRSRKVSKRLVQGIGFLMRKNKIDVIAGEAKLTGKAEISVSADGEVKKISAKNIIIATGAHPFMIPGAEADGEKVLTYRDAILQTTLPESAIIIGAGAIGAEFATVWSSYGVKVSIVEMLPRVLPLEDEEVSAELEKAFAKRGIDIHTGTKVMKITSTAKGVEVIVSKDDEESVLKADQVLVAIGFRPNSKGLGLEDVGVKINERGFIPVDDKMATNVKGIWAIGDVTGNLQLAHVASAMGIVCAENITGKKSVKLNYTNMPRATYSHPQVASFGLTEAQAKEKGHEVKTGKFPFQANGKALGLGDYGGFVKLVMDAKTEKLLGAHMVGPDVSELLPELTLAANNELSVEDIGRNVHAHPTLSEVIMEAAHGTVGSAIHM